MTKVIEIIKPLIRRIRRVKARWKYSRKRAKDEPITFAFPKDVSFRLYPWGQIAEFLYIGGFEKIELELTNSYLREGMNVIDVGANIGLYSILAAKLIGKSGRVWAFEPSSETYEHLLKNLSLNGVDSVIPNKLALSDIDDIKLLLERSAGRGDAERYLSIYPNHPSLHNKSSADHGDSELVKVTSLDSYMDENLKNVKVDFIKIDVEGNEFPILRGAENLLRANPSVVLLFECNPIGCSWAGHKVEDVVDFLRTLGLGLFSWDKNRSEWGSSLECLYSAGNLWAASDKERLPKPLHS